MRVLLLILAMAFPALAQAAERSGAMTFRVVRPANCSGATCIDYILGEGFLMPNTYERFVEVAKTLKRPLPVRLRSEGGVVSGGVLLGYVLRQYRASVAVERGAECSSACAYAFIGGAVRTVPQGSRLGVHRSYTVSIVGNRAVVGPPSATVTALLPKYIAEMGGDPALITLATSVDPKTMRYLSRAELARYRVVTAGSRAAPPPAGAGGAKGAGASRRS